MTQYSKAIGDKAQRALLFSEGLHVLSGELSAMAGFVSDMGADREVLELRWLAGDVGTWSRQVYRTSEELRKLANRLRTLEEQQEERA